LKINDNSIVNKVFEVDKGHKNGSELHYVTFNGIIFIFNKNTKRLITVLIARPAQIERLYEAVGKKPLRSILMKAQKNMDKGLNLI